jgi:hypothetical protein
MAENHRLKKENEQMTHFIKELLAKPSFRSHLEELATTSSQAQNSSMPPPPRRAVSNSMTMSPNTPTNMQNFSMATSPMSFSQPAQQDFAQGQQTTRPSGQDFDMSAIGGLNLQGAGDQWGNGNAQLGSGGDLWDNGAMGADFNNFNAFAVLELPEGPSFNEISADVLSGKHSNPLEAAIDEKESSKLSYPTISEPMPTSPGKADAPTAVPAMPTSESSDTSYDLFFETPTSEPRMSPTDSPRIGKYNLVVFPSLIEISSEERLDRMCHDLDATVERLENLL